MKSFQVLLIALIVACASAFVPAQQSRAAFKPLEAQKLPEVVSEVKKNKNAAAVAVFATTMAPMAAFADTAVDEGTLVGYGSALVACVVSLAVGFAIGYGTLAKL